MAERVGFEPTVPLQVHLISNQARSTGLRHLSAAAQASRIGAIWVPAWLGSGVFGGGFGGNGADSPPSSPRASLRAPKRRGFAGWPSF